MKLLRFGLLALIPLAIALIHIGCEVDSADTFSRDVATDFSGYYTSCENDTAIVQANSGNRIRTLDLRQSGDTLEAVDNNGAIWRGSLGEVQDGRSSFELKGRTSTGIEGYFSGTLSSSDGGSTNSGGSANGTMTGTYIEPDRYSTFCGTATIPGTKSTNTSTNDVDDDDDDNSSTNEVPTTNNPVITAGMNRVAHPWNEPVLARNAYEQAIWRLMEPGQQG